MTIQYATPLQAECTRLNSQTIPNPRDSPTKSRDYNNMARKAKETNKYAVTITFEEGDMYKATVKFSHDGVSLSVSSTLHLIESDAITEAFERLFTALDKLR